MPKNIDWVHRTFSGKDYWEWTKEGDEDILMATNDNIVYKIDRNRGLTQEKYIEDYGVTNLKARGEWDENADWAKFAMDLDISDHINTLSVMAKYIDSAISKTINVPNDYPFKSFKNVYFDAWRNGVKGITTYREGTMTNVLSTTSTSKSNQIVKTNAPKRPTTLKCDVHHFVTKGIPYCVILGLLDNDPYEAFIIRNMDNSGEYLIPKHLKEGRITKEARSNYKLYYNGSEFSITKNTDEYEEIISRLVSMSLRHGVDVSYVLHQLEKSKKDLFSLGQSMVKCLKKYVPDGTEIKGEECPRCMNTLIRQEGCATCLCGYSLCA
jgi:ribonucleoside-diphosphate reductase alpha chain